jgi:hypothetical protein
MRRWAARAWIHAAGVSIPLALLFVQCGGGSSTPDDGDLALPNRIDVADSGADASDAPRSDAKPSPDGALVDAAPLRCDPSKPFGTPVRLPEFDAAGLRSTPRLSADELTIYFTTSVGTTSDLSMATRTSTSAPFANEKTLPQSGPSTDNDPSVGADHLTLWFHSGRNGTADIFLATRAAPTGPFGTAVAIPTVNSALTNENHAYFRAAGSELWFISDRPGGAGGYDIYTSAKSGAAFAPPTRIAELSSPSADWQPQPSEDGLTILFASDRPGGKGLLDLWIASRATINAPWGTPAPLTELNSANVEQAGWLSADRCRIWFSSGRNTADLTPQLFFAQRPF